MATPAKKKAAPATKAAPAKKAAPAAKKAAPAAATTKKKAAPAAKKATPPAKSAAATKASPAKKAAPAAEKSPAPAKKAPPPPAAKQAPPPAPAPAKKAPAKKPAMLDKFAEGQKALLLEERATYVEHASALKQEADDIARDRDPGDVQFDEESGQGDTMNVERERDLALSAQALAAVDEIDRALEKLTEGTYGVCEKCGQSIPKERLKAIPWAALCVTCKSGGLSRR